MSEPDRGELLRLLAHVHYPATRRQIFDQLIEHGAPEAHLARIDELPDETYVEPDTVLQALRHGPG
ncbi:DUF2795 domain-containing protein [Saccharopolyspora sp. HNM0983]|uniref:DUF2795 domain-containing protein n=1 Tax=Saccharopolyspora montiporae TaxID=2781240 RepID=A0A929G1S4_9PSEU|nr:DUF2795 domain-containing protein [Saccharopolyspora sp. HNM0983]MBE9376584.1 DUF2795 domain-containing protein [Saccharopolyspora sp. HNM0983]